MAAFGTPRPWCARHAERRSPAGPTPARAGARRCATDRAAVVGVEAAVRPLPVPRVPASTRRGLESGAVPTFCRHNRFAENCPICAKKEQSGTSQPPAPRRAPKPAGSAHARPARGTTRGMVVRKMARAVDDGYEHDLVPGCAPPRTRARLAEELAFASRASSELRSDAARPVRRRSPRPSDLEEATWLAFLIAYVSPTEDEDALGRRAGRRRAVGDRRAARARARRAAGPAHRPCPRARRARTGRLPPVGGARRPPASGHRAGT